MDIDYSNIKIEKIFINKSNNDCVDLSSGKYEFVELNLSECGDKALSVGEKSIVKLNDLEVFKSVIKSQGFIIQEGSSKRVGPSIFSEIIIQA